MSVLTFMLTNNVVVDEVSCIITGEKLLLGKQQSNSDHLILSCEALWTMLLETSRTQGFGTFYD